MNTPPQAKPAIELGSLQTERMACTHSRAVDEVRSHNGSMTGELRCLECQEIFPDPQAAAEDTL